ncbi:hypothetical protein H4219_000963 [Mycoemilia scoparia]|uniref:AP-2 complex subunit alpha n=1 Tax=Mycoemilia scoparia TaxID=417184 RepID=A0A9W8DWT3_9FUNG|nr:hypothetical protein H4219_000963 [Mycoemilia scoparia]
MSMRGLTVFIADLRKCQSHEEEERRVNKELGNIRANFNNEKGLNGYNRKKYVSKLLYMSLLGYEVNFGHREALDLIQSSKYTEKQMGYLALTLLLNENDDFLRLVVNSVRKDLYDTSELVVCLALHSIANLGNQEMAQTLGSDVYSILVSNRTGPFARKKAALCLLKLIRKEPSIIETKRWLLPIMELVLHPDLGVATSVTSLVTTLAQQFNEEMSEIAPEIAIRRLKSIILDKEFTHDHIYYRIPVPWLQIKLLRLLQYFPAPEKVEMQETIVNAIRAIIDMSQDLPPDPQQINTQYSILFEAVNLAIHLDLDRDLLSKAAQLLGRFISSRETNVRYLGLETMSHLAAHMDNAPVLREYHPVIVQSLRDRDISVRRRALDLLYSMCTISSAKGTVMELLRHMPSAEASMREDMALKIAILTERYATEYTWYVDVMMRLISTAGDHMGEEVWYRVVQVVLGNEDLQTYAVKISLQTLKSPMCHENAFKVSAYVLGEFGHLIANDEGCAPINQLNALQSKMKTSTLSSRAIGLTTVGKLANLFPEVKTQCLHILNQYRSALDSELQQRACEYHAIISRSDDELIQSVFEEIPPFPVRQSALMSRLLKRETDTEDRRTWVHGGKVANRERRDRISSRKPGDGGDEDNDRDSSLLKEQYGDDDDDGLTREPLPTNAEADLLQLYDDEPLVEGTTDATVASQPYHDQLLWNRSGILFNDNDIQIGLNAVYKPPAGKLAVYIGNKTSQQITNVKLFLGHDEDKVVPTKTADGEIALDIKPAFTATQSANELPTEIMPSSQIRFMYDICCLGIFEPTASLSIEFMVGQRHRKLIMPLPVILLHFMDPVTITSNDFFIRWKQLGGPPRETQSVFRTDQGDVNDSVVEWSRKVVKGLNFAPVEGADPDLDNQVVVGIISTKNEGRFGCLARLEASKEHGMYRLTIRATNGDVAKYTLSSIQKIVGAGPDMMDQSD